MHRRARHLNPAAAGATLAFDARRLTGYADTDPVTTWTNLTGTNDATNVSANAPAFAVGTVNGQPAVRFTSTKALALTSAVNADISSCIFVVKKTSGAGMIPLGVSTSIYGSHPYYDFTDSNLYVANSSGFRLVSGGNLTSWTIATSVMDSGNTFTLKINGSTRSLGGFSTLAGTASVNRIGVRFNGGTTGDMAQIVLVPSIISSSLLRRLEQSAGFSFKLQCS